MLDGAATAPTRQYSAGSAHRDYVTGITMDCGRGHSLWSSLGLCFIMKKQRSVRMDDRKHRRVSRRKLICMVSTLLMVGGPILGSLCASGSCSSKKSDSVAQCAGMDMPKDPAILRANSSLSCCQMTQIPPATLSQKGETQKVKAELANLIVLTNVSAGPVAGYKIAFPHVDSSPPPDVQSLFCTLLI